MPGSPTSWKSAQRSFVSSAASTISRPKEGDTGSQEIDLRDEIEAEVEAATAEEAAKEEEPDSGDDEAEEQEAPDSDEDGDDGAGDSAAPRRRRRRGRRGGRGRRKELEATFDHGEQDGYGLWLDPAIKDNPVYTEHWAGNAR